MSPLIWAPSVNRDRCKEAVAKRYQLTTKSEVDSFFPEGQQGCTDN